MEVGNKIYLTAGQEATLTSGGVVSIPASWDDFLAYVEETTHRVEYHNGNTIIVGLATLIHELLVGQLIFLLKQFYAGKPYYVAAIRVFGRRGVAVTTMATLWLFVANPCMRAAHAPLSRTHI